AEGRALVTYENAVRLIDESGAGAIDEPLDCRATVDVLFGFLIIFDAYYDCPGRVDGELSGMMVAYARGVAPAPSCPAP
ncbi:MAG: hypothetical protein AAGA56_28885, partial [Myxococcota bacterium]